MENNSWVANSKKIRADHCSYFFGNKNRYMVIYIYGNLCNTKGRSVDEKVFVNLQIKNALEKMSHELKEILMLVSEHSHYMGYMAFLAGGTVRDILLGKQVKDLDIAVVGDAVKLVNTLCKGSQYSIRIYPRFQTATIQLCSGFKVDLITARREWYPCPAALPEVQPSNLYFDMYRRDFTINAVAAGLGPEDYGKIIDYFGGISDLKKDILRVMHDKSFIDDPTRIFRCIKFRYRYGFQVDKHTKNLMIQSIEDKLPLLLSRDRIAREMILLFSEKNPQCLIKEMESVGLWKLLFPGGDITSTTYDKIKRVSDETCANPIFVALALLDDIDHPNLQHVLAVYSSKVQQLKMLRQKEKTSGMFLRKRFVENYRLYKFFSGLDREVLDYLELVETPRWYLRNLKRYLSQVKEFPFYISGNDLKQMGICPGPVYKELLENARKVILNNEIKSREKQIQVLKMIVRKGGP